MQRLLSLDAFRGFVILLMIWVNYVAGMPGIPYWLEHAGPRADGITLPDLVFPGFLFIVGMSIPLAMRMPAFSPALAGRLLWRACSLMLAGVVLANAYRYDAATALLPRAWYFLLFYVAMVLLWRAGPRRWTFWLGIALMAFLLVAFRGTLNTEFSGVWLQHTWWGILGMIGWAYLACSVAWLATGGRPAALAGVFVAMIALSFAGAEGWLTWLPDTLSGFVNVPQVLGSTAANVLAGTFATQILLAQSNAEHGARLWRLGVLAAALMLAGMLLRPWHGINKIYATESYTLVCSSIVLATFMLFYWLIDVKQYRAAAAWLLPAGANALLAYILPDLWEQAAAVLHVPRVWWPYLTTGGMPGLLNAAAMTALMMTLVALANRADLKLKF
jgi:heparan-alpha-glucosaminide N-acetyltransferase